MGKSLPPDLFRWWIAAKPARRMGACAGDRKGPHPSRAETGARHLSRPGGRRRTAKARRGGCFRWPTIATLLSIETAVEGACLVQSQHIHRLEAAGKFPKRVGLGNRRRSRVGCVEREILDWLETRIVARDTRAEPNSIDEGRSAKFLIVSDLDGSNGIRFDGETGLDHGFRQPSSWSPRLLPRKARFHVWRITMLDGSPLKYWLSMVS